LLKAGRIYKCSVSNGEVIIENEDGEQMTVEISDSKNIRIKDSINKDHPFITSLIRDVTYAIGLTN